MKKAVLVTATVTVRVVVNDDAEEMDIIETAHGKLVDHLNSNMADYITEITDDTEVPYGTLNGES